ncbi:MAG TPA: glycosyltransferase family 87 protein, partial [Polyangia bacterium]|nr:glycosyltransferase family 87 protein [Polyangia bacterium]
WNSTVAATFTSDRAFAEYDLGSSVPINAAYLQGDNNDEYVVSVSEDRTNFAVLWVAHARPEPGLRDRWADGLNGHGRWIRVTVHGGDAAYSIAELQLFEQRPAQLPPTVRRAAGQSQAARVRSCLLYVLAAFVLFLGVTRAGARGWRVALAAAAPLAAIAYTVGAMADAWPVANREVALVRAVSAAVALAAALRYALPGRRWPAHKGAVTLSLAAAAAASFLAFYNLGHPQFLDHEHGRSEFVHTNDLRVYQPFAKYFKELQYDGVYEASILAYAEERRGGSLESLGMQEVRGLNDHRVHRVRDLTDDIRQVRARFSDERWAEFKQDMKFFMDVMGPDYLSTLTDHGANATPVWVFFARLLLGHASASEGLLVAAGLVDAVLLLLMALAMWRAFGLWPMLLAMTLFGANDLYMFGTNWTGATLRHDWLAMLGLGAAALKRERWTLGGICLALSALIRAFPVVALLGVCLPALWSFVERWRADRRRPNLKGWLADHPETVRVVGSAAITVFVMVLLTGALYGFASWGRWLQKVTLLNRDVGVNEISLRALVAGADATAGVVFQARVVLFIALEIACIGIVIWLARRRPLYQAMVLSVPLVLVISNPSNYYSHFVFVLALLADVRRAAPPVVAEARDGSTRAVPLIVPFQRVALPLLALCIGGYWAALDPDLDRHFQDETMLLFVALAWLYATLLRADPNTAAVLEVDGEGDGTQ